MLLSLARSLPLSIRADFTFYGAKPIDKKLLLRAARTQRYAGEGELVFGLTKHGGILREHGLACQRPGFGSFWGSSEKFCPNSLLKKGSF
jgi:hypothetical protein